MGRISTEHCVFSGKWSFHCGAKLACLRDGCGRVAALAWKYSRTTCAMELMVPGDFFSSLMMLCFCVLHVLRHFVHWRNCSVKKCVHFLNSWNLKDASHDSVLFHLFNSWNLKEASHDSVVFTSSTRGIGRMPRTKASLSHLRLLEFEGWLARKLRFHESWMRFECQDFNETLCFLG